MNLGARPIAYIAALAVTLTACTSDSCREYSKYTCAQLEKQTYNVYVYPPSDREYSAGQVVGLQACGATAHGYAAEHHFAESADWSYICCLQTDESSCAEKHR